MLAAVEAHYANALAAALGQATPVLRGPAPAVPAGASAQVLAGELALVVPADDLTRDRNAARLFTSHAWDADGAATEFPLPQGSGELAEVEAPPGRPRRRGDDVRVEAAALRFYRPPAAGQPGVRAMFLGTRAEGFFERRPGELRLVIAVRADTAAGLDAALATALAAALRASAALPTFEGPPAPGVRARLLRAAAALAGVTRRAERRGQVDLPYGELALVVRGEVELLVALGAPEPQSVITAVEPGTIDVG